MRAGGKTDRLDVRAEGDRGLQLQDSDIVVIVLSIVVWGHYQPLDVYDFRRGLFTTDLCCPHQGRPLCGVAVSGHGDRREDLTVIIHAAL